MGPDEYLERLFADSFTREIDQDEAIWRSLPFFATAVGLAGALVGYVASHLPALSLAAFSIVLHVLIGLALTSLAIAVIWLWMAVRPRRYRYLPRETALLDHANALKEYRNRVPMDGMSVDDAVITDLRRLMISEFAEAVSNNRAHNALKQRARTFALISLMIGSALAATASLAMFTAGRVESIRNGGHVYDKPVPGQIGSPEGAEKASSSAAPVRR